MLLLKLLIPQPQLHAYRTFMDMPTQSAKSQITGSGKKYPHKDFCVFSVMAYHFIIKFCHFINASYMYLISI